MWCTCALALVDAIRNVILAEMGWDSLCLIRSWTARHAQKIRRKITGARIAAGRRARGPPFASHLTSVHLSTQHIIGKRSAQSHHDGELNGKDRCFLSSTAACCDGRHRQDKTGANSHRQAGNSLDNRDEIEKPRE
jgi:hypothetical protein